MRPPAFWAADAGGRDAAPMLRLALAPVSALVAAIAQAKARGARPEKVPVPVVCVGNVTLGGVGKTPVTRAVRGLLVARGIKAATLSRGYGGTARGPLQVDPMRHDASAVGDEPLLHALDGPAFVARDRAAGARLAVESGAEAVVMDDGFQNFSLAKDVSLLVFDAEAGLGNGAIFPSGPLREPLSAALARADGVVLMRPGPDSGPPPAFLRGFTGPAFDAWLAPVGPPPEGPLVGFAGLGRPEKVYDTLKAVGADIADFAPFPDHHRFTPGDLAHLRRLAADRGARLVTTEKDYTRLSPEDRVGITPFAVATRFADPAVFEAWLVGRL